MTNEFKSLEVDYNNNLVKQLKKYSGLTNLDESFSSDGQEETGNSTLDLDFYGNSHFTSTNNTSNAHTNGTATIPFSSGCGGVDQMWEQSKNNM